MAQPEQKAREEIDRLLAQAGWQVFDMADANIHAARGVALREFPLKSGHGFADYLLYVDGKAAGVIEAKKQGTTLLGVEIQSGRYALGLPDGLPAWRRPLPFLYESTGVETHFTHGLDPEPRARPVFAFHRPETLAEWLQGIAQTTVLNSGAPAANAAGAPPATFLTRLRQRPPLVEEGLWPAQIKAVKNLEASLAANKPRALIQMATGSGKTFTAISFIYRLIKFAGARRVLFLVDRGNLGRQTKKEFDQYVSPYNNFKFGEEYIVQHLQGNQLDKSARVVICTIQRLYSMLKGRDLAEEDDEHSAEGLESLFKDAPPIEYNPGIPIETFDIVVTDEAHRSIYNLWRQVLDYFDAYLIGLTATPNKQTFGFFNQNLVMEYGHDQAVADGVNVNYDVYRIRTEVTEAGSKVEAGYWVQVQDRDTRARRDWQLDEDFDYDPAELDRSVQTPDQIRTVVRTLRDRWQADMFPQRSELPKTLVFAKDDNHAEAIVQILREEFGRGNDFAQKITYRSTGDTPENLIKAFRSSYWPRVAVTVDMIATGTVSNSCRVAASSNKQLNFVQHIKTLLDIPGRAAVVVPDNVLFEGGAGETIRRKLLHECEVHTLLRLPTGLFYAQGVKANVLFFDKKPASETPWTKKLWIYDLRTNQHFTLKTNPLKVEDLGEFVRLYNPANRHDRAPTWSPENPEGRWRAYDYEELVARDKASLDIFWLKDEALADSDNLPAPEVIAQEIVDDLEAALAQFREVLADLSEEVSAG